MRPPVGCAPSSFVAAKLCEAVVFLLGFLTVAGFRRESEKEKKETKEKKKKKQKTKNKTKIKPRSTWS